MNLRLRVSSNPSSDLVMKVQEAVALASADDEGKEPEVSTDGFVGVPSNAPPLPNDVPYWVPADIAPTPPPTLNSTKAVASEASDEESSSIVHTSTETRLLLASFPLACSTILMVILAVYGGSGVGWLVFGGLAWSGIILSAGVILKTVWDCVRKP